MRPSAPALLAGARQLGRLRTMRPSAPALLAGARQLGRVRTTTPIALALGLLAASATAAQAEMAMLAVDDVHAGTESVDVAAFRSGRDVGDAALSACMAKGRREGLGLAFFDKRGRTTKVLVGATGDAKADRCLAKAIKASTWPVTAGGGAVTFRVIVVALDAGAFARIPDGYRRGSITARGEGATAVGLRVAAARFGGEDVVTAETVADTVATDYATVLDARAAGATACYTGKDKALVTTASAVGFVNVSKAGKGKVTVGGSGVAALDRCLEKVLARAVWPKTASGGALLVAFEPAAGSSGSTATTATSLSTVGASTAGTGRVSAADPGSTVRSAGPAAPAPTTFGDKALEVVVKRRPQLLRCYARALEHENVTSAATTLHVSIDAKGKVTKASVSPALGTDLDACLAKVMTETVFPVPDAPTELAIPINLSK
jgi:hypothetical protein